MIIELEPDLITILETRAILLDVEPDLLINYSLRYQVPLEKIRGIDLAMDDVVNGRVEETTLEALMKNLEE